jgi:hypothetical protein
MSEHDLVERCQKCRGGNAETSVVWECLPVPAFGDLESGRIKVATIGLNPALDDWMENGRWKPIQERLPAIMDFQVVDREELTDAHIQTAIGKRANYFMDLQRSWHPWFMPLEALLGRVNSLWSYGNGSVVHLDLVACPTRDRFGALHGDCRKSLMTNCKEHFLRTLEKLPAETLLFLNGHWILDNLQHLDFKVRFDGGPDLITIEPQIIGWKGSLSFGQMQFPFRCWSAPVGKLHPRLQVEVSIWLRGSLKG